jgi:phosphate transport system substrate-binding protein
MRKRWWFAASAIAVLSIVAAACNSSSTDSGGGASASPSTELSGSIVISGSSTVLPISQLVAEQFSGQNPSVAISVDGPGTGDGFVLFCQGKTEVSDASRPIESTEAKACKQAGVNYVELKIGLDGITVMTNPQNSAVTCLNKGDLYSLFGPESNGIDTWNGADSLAKQVGGNDSFPSAPLTIIAPGTESGTYDAFIELAGIETTALAQGVPADKAAALRTDYQSSANDNVIIQGIEGSTTSLGFVGFAYADQQGDKIKEIQIDGGSGCVAPSKETIADASYPLSRSLYIYVNTDKAASSAALAAFVNYYLSDTGIQSVVQADYVAIPSSDLDTSRQAWAAAVPNASPSA